MVVVVVVFWSEPGIAVVVALEHDWWWGMRSVLAACEDCAGGEP